MKLADLLFGKPLATSEERAEQIGPVAGIPIFGLDALSSAAYGPEAALTLLIPLGLLGVHLIVPVSIAIIILLVIVYFSYRQTIEAYPQGGGSYTVATENLGKGPGLLAAAALMIDYILTAAVGISAGVGALISAVPSLQQHTLLLCLAILLILTIINLRGVHDTGVAFMIPTYLFLGTLLIVIAVGVFQTVTTGGHPMPVVAPPQLPPATAAALALAYPQSLRQRLHRHDRSRSRLQRRQGLPRADHEERQAHADHHHRAAHRPARRHRPSLPRLRHRRHRPRGPRLPERPLAADRAVMGHGVFYYVTIASILLVLSLSANTAFADFPRLTRAIALHDYLPHVFFVRGRRLLYSHGIDALVTLTALLLIIFGGVTDRLIPLYAIGAFLAFTLSQAGMVVHWLRNREPGWRLRMAVNGLGAFATGITTLVVLVAKFHDGAWITALLLPLMILLMTMVKRHYAHVERDTDNPHPLSIEGIKPPLVIIPLDRWSRLSEKAIRFALGMSPEIIAVHVDSSNDEASICDVWEKNVAEPLERAGLAVPQLTVLKSPYRFVLAPVIDFILQQEKANEHRQIAVLVPELVVSHWWENLLHNQRANLLKVLLLVKGNQRILVINIPWYLEGH